MNINKIQKIKIGGIFVNPLLIEDFIRLIDNYLLDNFSKALHITGVNPETFVHADKNKLVLQAIRDSDLINIDNIFVLLTLRLFFKKVPGRVATPDLFEEMLKLSCIRGYKIFILGAKEDVLTSAIEKIRLQYNNIKIVGQKDGFFQESEEVEIVKTIEKLKPHMIFVALPSPNKELFIYRNKKNFKNCVILGIGGAIDVKAGKTKRAPLFLRKFGLEGIHRSIQNPLNYGKRYVDYYPKFIKIVLKNIKH